jgi:hypothetical protein
MFFFAFCVIFISFGYATNQTASPTLFTVAPPTFVLDPSDGNVHGLGPDFSYKLLHRALFQVS